MLKYLLEIKNRLLLLFFSWVSTLFVIYFYKEILLFLIVQPKNFAICSNTNFTSVYFIFTNVTEIFLVYMKLITFLSFQVFFLHLAYHCFTFLNLAMFKQESYYLKTFLKFSVLSWSCSIFLTCFILIPISWKFFLSFQDTISSKLAPLHFEAKLNEYLSFFIITYYLCVFYCQFFTLLFCFLNYLSNHQVKIIKKFRKLFYYLFVIFSTIITPPDVFSQVGISLLAIVSYEMFIFICLFKIKLVR